MKNNKQLQKFKAKPQKSVLREWVEAAIVAGLLAIFLRTFFFQIYKIPTTSMVPTLMPKDKIFVSKLLYGPKIPFTKLRFPGFRKPQPGEIIVFIPPHDRKRAYIKRLIAMGGDTVRIEKGNIFVNGKKIVDPPIALNYYYNLGQYGQERQELEVPANHYFFLGDNSLSSADSRYWGFVPHEDIIGKAIFIWWPPKRVGMIE